MRWLAATARSRTLGRDEHIVGSETDAARGARSPARASRRQGRVRPWRPSRTASPAVHRRHRPAATAGPRRRRGSRCRSGARPSCGNRPAPTQDSRSQSAATAHDWYVVVVAEQGARSTDRVRPDEVTPRRRHVDHRHPLEHLELETWLGLVTAEFRRNLQTRQAAATNASTVVSGSRRSSSSAAMSASRIGAMASIRSNSSSRTSARPMSREP